MNPWMLQVLIWVKFGWPIAVQVYEVVKDGKVTKEELVQAVDKLLNGQDNLQLWKSKEK